jgi:hypothetical protein
MLDYLIDLFDIMPRTKLLGKLIRSQMEHEIIARRVRTCYEPILRLGRGSPPMAEGVCSARGDDPEKAADAKKKRPFSVQTRKCKGDIT